MCVSWLMAFLFCISSLVWWFLFSLFLRLLCTVQPLSPHVSFHLTARKLQSRAGQGSRGSDMMPASCVAFGGSRPAHITGRSL